MRLSTLETKLVLQEWSWSFGMEYRDTVPARWKQVFLGRKKLAIIKSDFTSPDGIRFPQNTTISYRYCPSRIRLKMIKHILKRRILKRVRGTDNIEERAADIFGTQVKR